MYVKRNLDCMFRFKRPIDQEDEECGIRLKNLLSNAKTRRFAQLNTQMYEGDLETRINNSLEHAKLWIDMWSRFDLEALADFALQLAQRKNQCVGILNLLVWASLFDSPKHFIKVVQQSKTEKDAKEYLVDFLASESGAQPYPEFSLIELGLYNKMHDQKKVVDFESGILEYSRHLSLDGSPVEKYLRCFLSSKQFADKRSSFLSMIRRLEATAES